MRKQDPHHRQDGMVTGQTSFPFTMMTKPAGAACNLDCEYCFYLEKEKLYKASASQQRMSDQVLEAYVRDYIAAQPGNQVTFAWQGGEPTLMGLAFYERAVAFQKQYANGKRVNNAFQTNGVLLNDDWCRFFKAHDFLVGISIDGPEELHDHFRYNKGGGGSFAQVMRGLNFLKKHEVEFNTLTVLHHENVDDPLRIYRFLKEIGSRYHQFIPIVERLSLREPADGLTLVSPAFEGKAHVTPWSLTSAQYGRFLVEVFDEWVRHDIETISVQIFDSALSTWAGQGAGLCIFSETCGYGPAMEHNGDVYSCDHYVYPDYRLGNIMDTSFVELIEGPQQTKFGQDKAASLPTKCRECPVRFACHGGCPKHRINKAPNGEEGLNYFCSAYQQFFLHADPYLRRLAYQIGHNLSVRPVMEWAQTQRRDFAKTANVGRNDLCPCGSGKKYKKCCGRSEAR